HRRRDRAPVPPRRPRGAGCVRAPPRRGPLVRRRARRGGPECAGRTRLDLARGGAPRARRVRGGGRVTPVLAVFLPLAIAYATALQWVWDIWVLEESYYSHGPLLPLLAAFVVWRTRARWSSLPRAADPRGWWLLGPGLLLHLVGAALTIDSLSAASLCL